MTNLEISKYLSQTGETLRQLIGFDSEELLRNGFFYIGNCSGRNDKNETTFCHYMSATLIGKEDRIHPFITIVSPSEDKLKIKEGLERLLGVKLIEWQKKQE